MYANILVGVDLNDEASWKSALPIAVDICRKFGARMSIVTVVPDFGLPTVRQFFPDDFSDRALAEVKLQLRALVEAELPADLSVKTIVAYGTPYAEILRVAADLDCDLIVLRSHRPELKDYLLGPNAARVVRHADCSVLVVRD